MKLKCSKCGEPRCSPGYDICWSCAHPKEDRFGAPDISNLTEKQQYWKKYEKTLVRMAHDMNRIWNKNDIPASVKIPSNPDEGWYIKERHERYIQSRIDNTEIGACG